MKTCLFYVVAVMCYVFSFVVLQWFSINLGVCMDPPMFVLDVGVKPLTGWWSKCKLYSWYKCYCLDFKKGLLK